MYAIVVFESHWGNTAAIARAIAEGIGPDAKAITTTEATPEVVATADLVVAGAPVMAFGLPSDKMIENTANDAKAPTPADVSHPSLRTWLARLPRVEGGGRTPVAAAFETRLWWSPGGAIKPIDERLRTAGFEVMSRGAKFVVKGSYGPLREGELERAREWGKSLRTGLARGA